MGIVWGYAFECKKLKIQTPVKKFGGGNIIMALHKTYDACVFCFAIVACIAINSQIFLQQYLPKLWLIKTLGIIVLSTGKSQD